MFDKIIEKTIHSRLYAFLELTIYFMKNSLVLERIIPPSML